ncbi:methyl-accepting chemotaxis protein [Sphingomonas cavernae]|uniref:Methyl-accepting chemotaxis protein n=2 Tax=Sphingomonas cavernae TaxID=2320861 RepID=A0A418W861_9SPHN|nr:methyl-accepting chemotaxis protein [Sphingomonas cavernae]
MLIAFTLIAIFVAALGGSAIIANKRLSEISDDHVKNSLAAASTLSDVRGFVREYRILVYSVVTARSEKELAELNGRLAKNHENIDEAVEAYEKFSDESLDGQIEDFGTKVATLKEVNQRIFDLKGQNQPDQAMEVLKTDGKAASHAAIKATNKLMEDTIKIAEQKGADGNSFANNALMFMSVMMALTIGLLALVWNVLNRTVSRPLGELTTVTSTLAEGREAMVPHRDRADELGEIAKAVELFRLAAVARQEADRKLAEEQQLVTTTLGDSLASLAQGDLTVEVKAEFPTGVASLKTNFNDAVERLREMIGAVSESATGIRTGSQEIAQASEDLARRTEGNAASLEETSAALVQIDDRLKATAVAAGRTVGRADQAIATVSGGRSIADEAVQAMERVRESATGIDSVIEGLDKIAFQTRVLAMNAAVEAGRAGDAGRGFAVVADLVSALAMRSEEEAKRAREQLTATQTDIVMAVGAVQKVDGALADISGDVSEVHTLLGSMAADNQAQSSAISQISVAISTMDQSTQQNAAMVEETSAAARNLTSEVTSLAEQAALFKVDNERRPVARKPAAASAVKTGGGATSKPYVSPVKALPVSAMAKANGASNGHGSKEDWSDF